MRKATTLLATLVACGLLAGSAFASNVVRISQVYGGGGGGSTTTTTYNQDYVELFNNSGSPVSVAGWVIEYGSATGNWGSATTNYYTLPAGATIPACGYLLIACGSVGLNGAVPPVPSPDFTTTNMSMSATNGKVGLFSALNANVACGFETPAGVIVDKVAWGTGNCPEGTAVAALSNTSGAVRNGGGTVDTDANSADFAIVTNPVPRNSGSPRNSGCVSAFTGACCLRNTTPGACASNLQADCDGLGGIFLGAGVACSPVPCETPTKPRTWGSIKSIYR
jgi:hypothetical protein